MPTGLERIAEKARQEPSLRFTSLAHQLTTEGLWRALHHIPSSTAPGTDGITQPQAVDTFATWAEPMLQSVHQRGYHPPAVRRVGIPKPGKTAKRPLGVPSVADRALQRGVAEVLGAIYEQDFLPCSFGGRPGRGAHQALAPLNEIIGGKRVRGVLEADLKNFFGSLDHQWRMRFVEHRVGDPRLLRLIRRWLTVGVREAGQVHESTEGTPQGGSISVLLSNVYLHSVLDLWFAKAIKPKLRGEAYLVRYIDDFVVGFAHREDAVRFHAVRSQRLGKFRLELEPDKTRLIAFGRFAARNAGRQGRKQPDTLYVLGFTHYCTRHRNGGFQVGRKTEKTRLRRSWSQLPETMRAMRHDPVEVPGQVLNQLLQGHYAYYGMAGNMRALIPVYQATESYWHRRLSSRSQKSYVTWTEFQALKQRFPLKRPKLFISYQDWPHYAIL